MKVVVRSALSVVIVGAGMLTCSPASGAEPDASLYVGLKSCRMCHKKKATGNQHAKWLAGPHAKAFKVLATEEAKATAAALGIADAQKSGKC